MGLTVEIPVAASPIHKFLLIHYQPVSPESIELLRSDTENHAGRCLEEYDQHSLNCLTWNSMCCRRFIRVFQYHDYID
jgi:hypothetical protein